MKSPLNLWVIVPLIVCLLIFRDVQADSSGEYEQLKARIELLEKEIIRLNKRQDKNNSEQNEKIKQAFTLNDKQLRSMLKKWSKNNGVKNISKKKAKSKPTTRKSTKKISAKNKIAKKKKQKKINKNNKIKTAKNTKKIRPVKGALFPKAGKIKVNLQYSLAETTGRQLTVNGFSLLPIFVVGNIESQDIVSTSQTVSLSISRSLANDSQISINIPYSQKNEERTNDSGQTTVQTRKSSRGLGDIRVTYSKQIFKNIDKLPSMIGAVTWKTTTGKGPYEDLDALALGSGFNAIRAGVTAIKQDDPAVLFASTGYTLNMKEDKGDFGDIDPGNTYDLSLGVVYSLTDKLSMNFGLDQAWTAKTRVNNTELIDSDSHTAALSIGAKLKFSSKRSISIRTKIGLNESTPGFQMQLGIPLKN